MSTWQEDTTWAAVADCLHRGRPARPPASHRRPKPSPAAQTLTLHNIIPDELPAWWKHRPARRELVV
ncbi:hypothetical protein E2C01_061356 [Portunus trituberculatus]|uniref:Uncharacterized protein n=1 Tax=Portunus trituberculatus TaxID=210409 RepID=A0A5B7H4Z4_PORTR|nr:hypothetical protein [Portunus trituberculatus]